MPELSQKTRSSDIAVAVKQVSFAFGNVEILNNLSFAIPRGVIAGIIGPNGSGKTTLLKLLLGLFEPKSGIIEIAGSPAGVLSLRVGYVPQRFDFDRNFPMTAWEFVTLNMKVSKMEALEKIREVGLSEAVLETRIGSLSGGELQRLLLAKSLLLKPEILFLDEPAANIDVVGESRLQKILENEKEENGTTIIIVSHDISFVARAVEQVICLNRELLCTGSPKDTLTPEVLEKLFENSKLYHHH
jgi:zinc transport system ATP-binding protein